MPSCVISTTLQGDCAVVFNNDVDVGVLKIYAGTSPGPNNAATGLLLATLTLPAKTSNSVSGGAVTFGSIASVNALASGTAGYARILKTDDSTVLTDVDVGESGASINLNTVVLTEGYGVSITSLVVTMPAGS